MKLTDDVIELLKEDIYKYRYRSKCLVMYMVLSERERLDEQLRSVKFRATDRIQLVLFRAVNAQDRLGLLYWNKCNNANVKYDILYDTYLDEIVEYEGKKYLL